MIEHNYLIIVRNFGTSQRDELTVLAVNLHSICVVSTRCSSTRTQPAIHQVATAAACVGFSKNTPK